MCSKDEELKRRLKVLEGKIKFVNREVYVLKRVLEGVIVTRKQFLNEEDATTRSLREFINILDAFKVKMNEKEVEVQLEEDLAGIFKSRALNAKKFIDVIKNIRQIQRDLVAAEFLYMPGKCTSHTEAGLAFPLLNALQEFEVAYIEYMSFL